MADKQTKVSQGARTAVPLHLCLVTKKYFTVVLKIQIKSHSLPGIICCGNQHVGVLTLQHSVSHNFSTINSLNKINGIIIEHLWKNTAGNSQQRLHEITAKPIHDWIRNLDF